MIDELVQAAEIHAAEAHGIRGQLTIGDVEKILADERAGQHHSAIIPCFGAWLGASMLAEFNGEWVGLGEPIAPRIAIGGLLYSPFDAVARRLTDPRSTSLSELIEQLRARQQELLSTNPADWAERNRQCWDELAGQAGFVHDGWLPSTAAEAQEAIDAWLREESIAGKSLLCLAAGGGTHGPLHALAGAEVTVVDFSEKLLDIDRRVAHERGLPIRTVCNSMEALHGVASNSFDIVLQPVSMCYVPDPRAVYVEVRRVLRAGGLYVVQHKQPVSLQATAPLPGGYQLEFPQRAGVALPPVAHGRPAQPQREQQAVEYAHSLESLIGALCNSGFILEGFTEPIRGDMWAVVGTPAHRALYAPPYMKLKARRV